MRGEGKNPGVHIEKAVTVEGGTKTVVFSHPEKAVHYETASSYGLDRLVQVCQEFSGNPEELKVSSKRERVVQLCSRVLDTMETDRVALLKMRDVKKFRGTKREAEQLEFIQQLSTIVAGLKYTIHDIAMWEMRLASEPKERASREGDEQAVEEFEMHAAFFRAGYPQALGFAQNYINVLKEIPIGGALNWRTVVRKVQTMMPIMSLLAMASTTSLVIEGDTPAPDPVAELKVKEESTSIKNLDTRPEKTIRLLTPPQSRIPFGGTGKNRGKEKFQKAEPRKIGSFDDLFPSDEKKLDDGSLPSALEVEGGQGEDGEDDGDGPPGVGSGRHGKLGLGGNRGKETEVGEPNMKGGGEEGAEQENVSRVGTVLEKKVSDAMWVTGFVTTDKNGQLVPILPDDITSYGAHRRPVAKVRLEPFFVSDNMVVVLPTIAGIVPYHITVDPPDITFRVSEEGSHQVMFYKGSSTQVTVTYDLVSVEMSSMKEDVPYQSTPDLRQPVSAEEQAVFEAVRDAQSEDLPDIFSQHLRTFRYVTSSDLDHLYSLIPGRPEEKMAGIQVGDCDMFSSYLMQLAQRARRRDVHMTVGTVQDGDAIVDSPGHARVVIQTKEGMSSYETTNKPVQPAMKNVKFLRDDLKELYQIVSQMNELENTDGSLVQQYVIFRGTLDRILAKPEYEKFLLVPTLGADGTDGFDTKNQTLMNHIRNKVEDQVEDWFEKWRDFDPGRRDNVWELIFAISGATVVGFAALVKMLLMMENAGWKKLRASNGEIVKQYLLHHRASDKPLAGTPSDQEMKLRKLNQLKESLSDELGELEELLAQLPLTSVLELQRIIRLIEVLRSWPEISPMFLSFLRQQSRVEDMIKMIGEQGGATIESVERAIYAIIHDKEFVQSAIDAIPERVNGILRGASEYMVAFENIANHMKRQGRNMTADDIHHMLWADMSPQGDVPTGKPSHTASMDYFDHVRYQPGMDTKRIDWRATGRSDQVLLRRSPQEREPRSNMDKNVHVVIGIPGDEFVHPHLKQMERFSALILFLRKTRAFSIKSICLVNRGGQLIQRLDQSMVRTLLQKSGNPHADDPLRQLLDSIEHSFVDSCLDRPLVEEEKKNIKKRVVRKLFHRTLSEDDLSALGIRHGKDIVVPFGVEAIHDYDTGDGVSDNSRLKDSRFIRIQEKPKPPVIEEKPKKRRFLPRLRKK